MEWKPDGDPSAKSMGAFQRKIPGLDPDPNLTYIPYPCPLLAWDWLAYVPLLLMEM